MIFLMVQFWKLSGGKISSMQEVTFSVLAGCIDLIIICQVVGWLPSCYQLIIFNNIPMSRRTVSPMRPRVNQDPAIPDERENIIRRLKEELIAARGKEKEVQILENHLADLIEKNRIISDDNRRRETDSKIKADSTLKIIAELKRQADILKVQLKNNNIQLGEKETDQLELKRHLAKRSNEIEKVRKEGVYLKEESQNLLMDHSDLLSRFEQADAELRRIEATSRTYDTRISEINAKTAEVKAYIGQLNDQTRILKEKLRKYQQDNNNISDDLNEKQDRIDQLERVFAEEHEIIKNQVEDYIESEHKNEKTLTEIRHKVNLLKAQNDKTNELNGYLQRVDKAITAVSRDQQAVNQEIHELDTANKDYESLNVQLERDHDKCQAHLQNLMRHNAYIQEELEKYLREDEQILAVIRKKRILPTSGQLINMRESRKNTDRTYV